MPEAELFGRTYRLPVPLPRGYLIAPALALAIAVGAFTKPHAGAGPSRRESLAAAEPSLARSISDADTMDPAGWRLDAIRRERRDVAEDQDAAKVVLEAYRRLPDDWIVRNQEIAYPAADSRSRTPPGGIDFGARDPMLPESESLAAIRGRLQPLTAAIERARRLAGMREGRFAVDDELYSPDAPLPHLSEVRLIAHLLALDALSRGGSGDIDGALVSCRAMLGAARSIGDEPRLVSQLERMDIAVRTVQTVERVLACGEASAANLALIQSELADEMRSPWVLNGLRGERAVLFDSFDRIIRAEPPLIRVEDRSASPNSAETSERKGSERLALLCGSQAQVLSQMNRAIRIARRASRYQETEWRQYLHELEKSDHGLGALPLEWKANSRLPSAELIVLAGRTGLRAQAYLACAALALACERQRVETGAFPESSKAIESNYLDAPPVDAYGRGSVRLSILRDGIEAIAAGSSPGISKPNNHGSAIGFRLLNPDSRSPSTVGEARATPEANPGWEV